MTYKHHKNTDKRNRQEILKLYRRKKTKLFPKKPNNQETLRKERSIITIICIWYSRKCMKKSTKISLSLSSIIVFDLWEHACNPAKMVFASTSSGETDDSL